MNSISVLLVYASLLFIGGVIGFVKSSSMPSLVMGLLSSIFLLGAAFAAERKKSWGYCLASLITFFLALFFSYRFYKTGAVMPAALMSALSWAVFTYLALIRLGKCKK